MFHISRTIAFVACLIAACTVNWWVGLLGLLIALVVIPNPYRRAK